MSEYSSELARAMEWLAQQQRTVFLGQGVAYPGTFMSNTLSGVPMEKRIELPVAEEMQMGISIGLSINGFVPITIYPRWNFLILAANQLVNHLDKLPLISGYRPAIIVRVGVGSEKPLDPGEQHKGDWTDAFQILLKTIPVVRLDRADKIFPAYRNAFERGGAAVLVEIADLF